MIKELYYDNSSTSYPKFSILYEQTMQIYKDLGLNFSRNTYKKSKEARKIKGKLIENLQRIFSTTNDVVINSSATFSLNEIIQGLDYSEIKTIYISPFEHNSVYRPIEMLKSKGQITYDIAKVEPRDEEATLKNFEALIRPNTRYIICTHASNVFGSVLPIKKIGKLAKKHKLNFIVDAAQSAGCAQYRVKAR